MKGFVSGAAVLSVVLWGSLVVAPASHAQEVVSAAQASLTNDDLKTMLSNLGLEPKPLSKGFLLAIKRDTWTINMQIVLSPDLTKLGLNANLGKIDNPETVTAEQWKNLLISNGDIDPSAFYFDKDQGKLYLHRSMDNRDVSPSFLRKQIDNFADNVKSTADLWKFTK